MPGHRRSDRVPLVLGSAAVLGLIMWIAGSGVAFVVGTAYELPGNQPEGTASTAMVSGTPPAAVSPDPGALTRPVWLVPVLSLLAAALVVVALWQVWRWWTGRRLPPRPQEPVPSVAQSVLADAEEQFITLRAGAPGGAIIACWRRLESAIASAGHPARDWQTPAEVTAFVLTAFAVDGDAVEELADLYREARFSRHVLGEAERERALAALAVVHDGLRADAADVAPRTGESW